MRFERVDRPGCGSPKTKGVDQIENSGFQVHVWKPFPSQHLIGSPRLAKSDHLSSLHQKTGGEILPLHSNASPTVTKLAPDVIQGMLLLLMTIRN